jgi:hypothetical protein
VIREINPYFCHLMGYTANELIGVEPANFIPAMRNMKGLANLNMMPSPGMVRAALRPGWSGRMGGYSISCYRKHPWIRYQGLYRQDHRGGFSEHWPYRTPRQV